MFISASVCEATNKIIFCVILCSTVRVDVDQPMREMKMTASGTFLIWRDF